MKAIKEYLDWNKAKKLKDKIDPLLPMGVECILEYKGSKSYRESELIIKNKHGATKELSRSENDMKELMNSIFDICKRFYISFTFHSHGLDYVYISIEVR